MAVEKGKKAADTGDFDLDTLAPQVSRHETDLVALSERIKAIETILTPEGFVSFLEKEQMVGKRLDSFLSKVFLYLLTKDEGVKKAITEFMNSCDRSVVWKTLKVFGGFIGWVLSLLLAAYVGHLWA